jgi:adenine-specific DNA-methyltransferase
MDYSATFVRRCIEAFAAQASPTARLSSPFAKPFARLDKAIIQLADTVGLEAAGLPLGEGLHFVTSLYPALLSAHDRAKLGAFYTPPALASRLLDQATEEGVTWDTARILDPAAGGGIFLLQAANRIRQALKDCEPPFVLGQIGSRLLGLELDPNAASLAQAALEIFLADIADKAGRPVPSIVRVSDALEVSPRAEFDLVVGNPPYGRVTLSPEQRQRYKRSLYGHANLYGVFTDIALRWAKPNGLIAYLTPTSFLAGQYYSALRALLADQAPPVAIDFVHARRGVFEDVLQETLLAVYRKGSTPRRAQIHYLRVEDESEAAVTRNGTVGLPCNPSAPWLAPRNPDHSVLISCAEKMTARLADWGYTVSTGPLVWNRFNGQFRDKAGSSKRTFPLIWAEAVTADGRFVYRAQKRNHSLYFRLESGDDWLLVAEPCVLVQRTTAKEQARRLIAAELPAEFVNKHGGVVVENHLNMIRAKGNAQIPLSVVAALLNSKVVDDVFRCMNGSVAVSAFELEALPLPDPKDVKALARLVTRNAELSAVEAECNRLYGQIHE